MATTEQTNNANQALYDTIDKMCSAVDFLDNFPKSKQSKLIQFSVEFCDDYGVSKDAVDVVLKAKKNEDGKRELFIEVAGIVTETVTYDSEMAITNYVTASVTSAVITASGGVNPAGWFMAVATGGAYYALGSVIATATSKAAGEKAKIAAANLWDTYINKADRPDNKLILKTPNTEKELFTEEVLNGISSSLPDGTTVNIYTNSDTNLVLFTVGNNTTMEVHASRVFDPNSDAQDVQEWIKAVASSGATQVSINSSKTYNIVEDSNNLTVRNALDDIPAVSLLLSHILIKPGEKLDLGDKGIYTVKSGDTLSEIAEANGFNTKELLKKNSWFVCHRDYANNIGYRRREVA